jgi:hypothetical protein
LYTYDCRDYHFFILPFNCSNLNTCHMIYPSTTSYMIAKKKILVILFYGFVIITIVYHFKAKCFTTPTPPGVQNYVGPRSVTYHYWLQMFTLCISCACRLFVWSIINFC